MGVAFSFGLLFLLNVKFLLSLINLHGLRCRLYLSVLKSKLNILLDFSIDYGYLCIILLHCHTLGDLIMYSLINDLRWRSPDEFLWSRGLWYSWLVLAIAFKLELFLGHRLGFHRLIWLSILMDSGLRNIE